MDLKEIPGTIGFTISEDGVVYDPSGRKRNTYHNGDGYTTVAVFTKDKGWVTFGLHRLVALTYLDHQRTDERNEVNHRDSDLSNNHVSNLEWVTVSENNIHSEIMRVGNDYLTLIARRGDVVVGVYRNASEAAVLLSLDKLDIWDALKDSKEISGLRFFHRPFDKAIPKGFSTPIPREVFQRPIKMLDLDTNEVMIYGNINAAAKAHGVTTNHISNRILKNKNGVSLFRKRYRVCFADEEFPAVAEEDILRARAMGPKSVVAYNFEDGLYYIFDTAKEFIRLSGLSKKAVTVALVKNSFRKIGSWVATYRTPENQEKLEACVESPVPA